MDPFLFFYDYVRCGLWASSGPFPLSAHYGLYKRGRDPPTNPSRHLKKERSELPLKWLLKEDQRRRPTAATAARRCAAAETAASSCSLHVLPARLTVPSRRRRRHLRPPLRSAVPPHFFSSSTSFPSSPPPSSILPSTTHHPNPGINHFPSRSSTVTARISSPLPAPFFPPDPVATYLQTWGCSDCPLKPRNCPRLVSRDDPPPYPLLPSSSTHHPFPPKIPLSPLPISPSLTAILTPSLPGSFPIYPSTQGRPTVRIPSDASPPFPSTPDVILLPIPPTIPSIPHDLPTPSFNPDNPDSAAHRPQYPSAELIPRRTISTPHPELLGIPAGSLLHSLLPSPNPVSCATNLPNRRPVPFFFSPWRFGSFVTSLPPRGASRVLNSRLSNRRAHPPQGISTIPERFPAVDFLFTNIHEATSCWSTHLARMTTVWDRHYQSCAPLPSTRSCWVVAHTPHLASQLDWRLLNDSVPYERSPSPRPTGLVPRRLGTHSPPFILHRSLYFFQYFPHRLCRHRDLV